MYQIIFESPSTYEDLWIDLSYPLGFLLAAYFIFRNWFMLEWSKKHQFQYVFTGVAYGFLFIVAPLAGVYSRYSDYVLIDDAFTNKSYLEVNGSVENFQPMPKEGHKSESFTIGNAAFTYIGFANPDTPFFSQTKVYGGPIRGNGDHLLIQYIPAGAFELCVPFLPKCLEFNSKTDNKIIRMYRQNDS